MAEKVTIMKLKVDLQCEKCYKKVKKVLRKFPQIREQVFDEKQNIVTIKVVCCSPEKIRDKLCCKGCGAIKSIEIVEPRKPKPRPPSKPATEPENQEPPKSPPPSKPATEPEKQEPPKSPPPSKQPEKEKPATVPIGTCCVPCREGRPGGPCYLPAPKPAPPLPSAPVPIRTCCVPCSEGRPGGPCYAPAPNPAPPPPPALVPIGTCCGPCSEGRTGGPCFEGYCRPAPCYQGYFFARPVYDSYGGGRPCYVSRCDQYFNEDNATGCTIM